MSAANRDERVLAAKLAASERWGRTIDRTAATAPARNALRAKLEAEADPTNLLSPEQRAIRADSLMNAHMQRMSLRAAQARRMAKTQKRVQLELATLKSDPELRSAL